MLDIVVLNAVLIGAVTLLGFFFGGDGLGDRAATALGVFLVSLNFTVIAWALYVAVHFIVKFW